MSYRNHAMQEFRAAGWVDADGNWPEHTQRIMCDEVLELLELFSKHGHSGSSAPYAIRLFSKLASFEPIVPLTGEDWEWGDSFGGGQQNKRCSHVFKDNGRAYDIQGRIFREPNGCCYTGKKNRVYITFPYTPQSKYVNRGRFRALWGKLRRALKLGKEGEDDNAIRG
jgi:hypothetical protein